MNKKTEKEINKIKDKIIPVLKRHGIKRAGLFGSLVQGNMNKDSDIDVYVELPRNRHIGFEFFRIMRELKKELGRKVDLVDCSGGNPPIKKEILKKEVRIL